MTLWMSWTSWCNNKVPFPLLFLAMYDDFQLCNRCVCEFLILARTWFIFGLPSKTGCDSKVALRPRCGWWCSMARWAGHMGVLLCRAIRLKEGMKIRQEGARTLPHLGAKLEARSTSKICFDAFYLIGQAFNFEWFGTFISADCGRF
jgi:hypothetical protein